MKEYMRHFHAWAGIQRTRHEHRCAATQPLSQTFNARILLLKMLLILRPLMPYTALR
jgi:hypothetical protein